mgnify:CR=1 FL=1
MISVAPAHHATARAPHHLAIFMRSCCDPRLKLLHAFVAGTSLKHKNCGCSA